MSNLRLPFSAVGGVLLSSAVFLALYGFISVPLDVGDPIKTTIIDFTKQRVDTPVTNKRDPKIERPPPVAPTPKGPTLATDPGEGTGPPVFVHTRVEIPPTRHSPPGGVDRDAIPFVRPPPDYPPREQSRGIEGWVQIQFSITATGAVRDPIVVAADPPGHFEDAALKAIARWRYNPRVDGGVAVERVGLQTVIRFQLNQ